MPRSRPWNRGWAARAAELASLNELILTGSGGIFARSPPLLIRRVGCPIKVTTTAGTSRGAAKGANLSGQYI